MANVQEGILAVSGEYSKNHPGWKFASLCVRTREQFELYLKKKKKRKGGALICRNLWLNYWYSADTGKWRTNCWPADVHPLHGHRTSTVRANYIMCSAPRPVRHSKLPIGVKIKYACVCLSHCISPKRTLATCQECIPNICPSACWTTWRRHNTDAWMEGYLTSSVVILKPLGWDYHQAFFFMRHTDPLVSVTFPNRNTIHTEKVDEWASGGKNVRARACRI